MFSRFPMCSIAEYFAIRANETFVDRSGQVIGSCACSFHIEALFVSILFSVECSETKVSRNCTILRIKSDFSMFFTIW